MKKIIYLSFYFSPDLSAGSFRNTNLAKTIALNSKHNNIEIDVYTTLPQRYKSFSAEALEYERIDNLSIYRIKVPKHDGSILNQIISFIIYFRKVYFLTRDQNVDLVFASSSRLFTAYLGYLLSVKFNTKLIIDIRDIFVDTINEIVKSKFFKLLGLPILKHIESKVFNYATHINLISAGFINYFHKFDCKSISVYTNGIDMEFLQSIVENDHFSNITKSYKSIVYAGNIGEGQGLHKIIPFAAQKLGVAFRFIIIGDGGCKDLLEKQVLNLNLKNVIIEPPTERKNLISKYVDADYLFIHLNDYKAFRKVLPSKIFELATFKKFIIAGVSGHASEFIKKEIPFSFVFNPCDVESLVDFLKVHICDKNINRNTFIEKNKRSTIDSEFSSLILRYL
jgi:hypothetical protein